MTYDPKSRRIQILRDSVCRQIAAGEVAENPAAVLRELLDNSIDAESTTITVSIEEGGVKQICVHDNGAGMCRDDLEKCTLRHATSKLQSSQDLLETSTMGFRGEALASIAACSKLTILSGTGTKAFRLLTDASAKITIEETAFSQGTTIKATDLYYSLPARRNFLKNTSTETRHCFQVFRDKALAFPGIHFSFEADGKILAVYPIQPPQERSTLVMAEENLVDRILCARHSDPLCEVTAHAAPWQYHRKDKRGVKVFVNNRIITDAGLQRAVINAYSGFLPGGLFPLCAVFIQIDPKYADFNVHPAKTQVRFRDSLNLFPVVYKAVKLALNELSADASFSARSASTENSAPQPSFEFPVTAETALRYGQIPTGKDLQNQMGTAAIAAIRNTGTGSFIYLGTWDNLFLLVCKDDNLYLIDQHAAHERILFDGISSGSLLSQKLLFAAELKDLEKQRLDFYAQNAEKLFDSGFKFRIESDTLILTEIPDIMNGSIAGLLELFKTAELELHKWKTKAFALMACRAAVKEGDKLDQMAAVDLIEKTFSLPVPRCPHGRPVWIKISKEEAFERIGRKI